MSNPLSGRISGAARKARSMTVLLALTTGLAAFAGASASAAAPAGSEQTAAGAEQQAGQAPGITAIFNTFTVLNGGKNLASNLSGKAVTSIPAATNRFQNWERVFTTFPAQPGFSSPYKIRNRATNLCLEDRGNGVAVAEVPCQTSPSAFSPQLWHQHHAADRTVNGQNYRFRYNRSSGRVLSQAPQFGNTIPVVSSPEASNTGSAAAALQLWHFKSVV